MDIEHTKERDNVLLFNKALTRSRYSRINLELVQNIEPVANVLTNEDITEIIVSALGNAVLIPNERPEEEYSLTESYLSNLCKYNLGYYETEEELMFNPGLFEDIASYQKDNCDEMFDSFKDLVRDGGKFNAVVNPHIMMVPSEILSSELVIKTKKLLAYEILIEDNSNRKKLKTDLQSKIITYEKILLTLYHRLNEMRSTKTMDIESTKVELSIGYLLLALQEEGYEDVFRNKAKTKGLYINSDRLAEIKQNSKTGFLSEDIALTRKLNYVPLEHNFQATTVDPGNLFASANENNLEGLIEELSESITLEEIEEGALD